MILTPPRGQPPRGRRTRCVRQRLDCLRGESPRLREYRASIPAGGCRWSAEHRRRGRPPGRMAARYQAIDCPTPAHHRAGRRPARWRRWPAPPGRALPGVLHATRRRVASAPVAANTASSAVALAGPITAAAVALGLSVAASAAMASTVALTSRCEAASSTAMSAIQMPRGPGPTQLHGRRRLVPDRFVAGAGYRPWSTATPGSCPRSIGDRIRFRRDRNVSHQDSFHAHGATLSAKSRAVRSGCRYSSVAAIRCAVLASKPATSPARAPRSLPMARLAHRA